MIVQDVKPDIEVALFSMSSNADVCLNAVMVEHNLANSTGQLYAAFFRKILFCNLHF